MKTKKVDVVAGYSYPNDKNALWFDQNTNTMRYWDGEKWESSQSKGSSLPTPTAEDSSKIMQVTPVQKGTRTEETVMVPEQTCNMEEYYGKCTKCTLQNVDESFGPGFSGIAILDGIEYDVEWPEKFNSFIVANGVNMGHMFSDNFELVDRDFGLTHTIKVITRETEPIYDYNWAPGVKIPVPTAEDVGKVLKVVDKETQTTERVVIIPKQTLEMTAQVPTGGLSTLKKFGRINTFNHHAYNELKDGDYTYTIEINNNIINTQLGSYERGEELVYNTDQRIRFDDELELCYLVDDTKELVDPVIYVYADIPTTHHEYVWEMVDEDIP